MSPFLNSLIGSSALTVCVAICWLHHQGMNRHRNQNLELFSQPIEEFAGSWWVLDTYFILQS